MFMDFFHYLKHPAKQKRGELTSLAILESALDLIEKGHISYEKITLKDLSNQTGFSIGTIYRYFEDKDDLLASLGGFYLSKIHIQAKEILIEFPDHGNFRDLLETLIDHYLDNLKSQDLHQFIPIYRLFIRSLLEPELVCQLIDQLIPDFIQTTKRNTSKTFPNIETDALRIYLRGLSAMIFSPALEKDPFFFSKSYRILLIATTEHFMRNNTSHSEIFVSQ
jgi:AcrR family transcriptional regulator